MYSPTPKNVNHQDPILKHHRLPPMPNKVAPLQDFYPNRSAVTYSEAPLTGCINNWAGPNLLWSGVDLYSSKARYESVASVRRFLVVWTAHSASLLLCGYLGLLVAYWNPYSEPKVENVLHANCGLLSFTKVSGNPCHTNIDFRWAVTAEAFESVRFTIPRPLLANTFCLLGGKSLPLVSARVCLGALFEQETLHG